MALASSDPTPGSEEPSGFQGEPAPSSPQGILALDGARDPLQGGASVFSAFTFSGGLALRLPLAGTKPPFYGRSADTLPFHGNFPSPVS